MAVVTLAAAKTYLDITGSDHDGVLPEFIAASEAAIAERCGPLEATAKTDRVAGGGLALVLRSAPAISLTSVTPADGDALTLSDLYLDTGAGVVTMNSGAGFSARYYTVVYSAGRAECPAELVLAVKELVRHLWQPKRGPKTRASESTDPEVLRGMARLMSPRVTELIAPHIQPGFA